MSWVEATPLLRIVAATFVGSCLGAPFRFRTGGVRTHVLVAIGTVTFCVVGLRVAGPGNRELLRVIQGITSGVGFVGAATVLKKGSTISGVNVAASIWTTAALSCEVGLGQMWLAIALAPAIALGSWGYEIFERRSLARHGIHPASEDHEL